MGGNQSTRLLLDKEMEDLQLYPIREVFEAAADTFIKYVNGKIELWASSRDWFLEPWGRDAFISLPGILLTTRRWTEAKEVIRSYAQYERKGLIPNRIRLGLIEYNTADAAMWFIQAIKAYLEYTKEWDFIQELFPVLKSIIVNYTKGTGYMWQGQYMMIRMDKKDCLITNPPQATWMDADPSGKGRPITPRHGKAVEINALWYANLRFFLYVVNHLKKDHQIGEQIRENAERVKKSFNAKFWNYDENALYDVIEGDPHKGAIRPNMIIAVSHGCDLLTNRRQFGVVNSVLNDLLMPGGLRTLSPRDSNYKGEYNTYLPPEQKDYAYHQGTAWPWLLGPYCDALARVLKNKGKEKEEIQQIISRILAPLVRFCLESPFKSLPEVFSGSPPYYPGGTTSQAWSVAEVLRILVKYKIV